jgi:hypothetical protein
MEQYRNLFKEKPQQISLLLKCGSDTVEKLWIGSLNYRLVFANCLLNYAIAALKIFLGFLNGSIPLSAACRLNIQHPQGTLEVLYEGVV